MKKGHSAGRTLWIAPHRDSNISISHKPLLSSKKMVYSIIQKSQLEGTHRIDAEYYQPECLENDQIIKNYKNGFRFLGDLLKRKNAITGGATPLGANYPDSGVPFLRVQNVMPNYLDLSDQQKIADLVRKSRDARKKAKELLKEAKRKVEEMIEKS